MQVQNLRAAHRTRLCRPYSDHLQQILGVKKGAAKFVYAVHWILSAEQESRLCPVVEALAEAQCQASFFLSKRTGQCGVVRCC